MEEFALLWSMLANGNGLAFAGPDERPRRTHVLDLELVFKQQLIDKEVLDMVSLRQLMKVDVKIK